ncbi:MAG: copper amine oxidase N-terminal domain-containing protein [Defluviitaleaceae bacterium]|nr:copper amine oxidase N-terminal domain-containing protein [Defluviitaleaceae bacterium]
MKKFLFTCALVGPAMLFFAVYAYGLAVTVDSRQVEFEGQPPAVVGGRTLVPVRGVFEALGFEVHWNAEALQVTLIRPEDVIVITVGSETFSTNGWDYEFDVPAQIIEGRTMIPLRAVLESVGYDLDWIEEAGTIAISRFDVWENERPSALVSEFSGELPDGFHPLAFNSPEVDYTMSISFAPTDFTELTHEILPSLNLPVVRAHAAHTDGALEYILILVSDDDDDFRPLRIRIGEGELRSESTVYGFSDDVPLQVAYAHGIPVTTLMLDASGWGPLYFQSEFTVDGIMFRIAFYDSLRSGQLRMTELVNQIILGDMPNLLVLTGAGR